ncbi:hypothetical protein [Gaoshiqia sp. Z1-71]|uniref:hypothetical protein n=1 Tax=Gaoshiqia hydrogeniformans TaxID=3290090 RepID=UPI003BF788C2
MKSEAIYNQEHIQRTEGLYVKKIEQLYLLAAREAANIAMINNPESDPDKPFSFSDYPQTKSRIDKIFNVFAVNLAAIIHNGTKTEWLAATNKNDALVDRLLKTTDFKKEQVKHLYQRNLEALEAFQKRKIKGLSLSDRVWKYTRQFKGEIEMSIDIALADGRSAAELSRDIRGYLKEPEKLFRRVRNLRGNLVLSKNAMQYNPGGGVYRSSYKNAMRLARTEINMAYRESDFERWQQLDFVVGVEVRRSNHVFDCIVCESLKGKYPKDFKFIGWHPQCRCFAISILSTTDEFIKIETQKMRGEEPGAMQSVNEVKNVPSNFTKWISDNQERIERAKSKPYFIIDNSKYLINNKI